MSYQGIKIRTGTIPCVKDVGYVYSGAWWALFRMSCNEGDTSGVEDAKTPCCDIPTASQDNNKADEMKAIARKVFSERTNWLYIFITSDERSLYLYFERMQDPVGYRRATDRCYRFGKVGSLDVDPPPIFQSDVEN